MTWSSEFPFAGDVEPPSAPEAWSLDDLSYITEIVTLRNAEPRNDAAVAQAAADGHARGHEEGRLAGEREALGRLRTAVDTAKDALAQAAGKVRTWEAAFDDNVCALATVIARHLVDQELQGDPGILARLVQRARRELALGEAVRVRANPDDLAALNAVNGTEADGATLWIADATIAPGGCVVEGQERIIDGRVETTLDRLYRRLALNDD